MGPPDAAGGPAFIVEDAQDVVPVKKCSGQGREGLERAKGICNEASIRYPIDAD